MLSKYLITLPVPASLPWPILRTDTAAPPPAAVEGDVNNPAYFDISDMVKDAPPVGGRNGRDGTRGSCTVLRTRCHGLARLVVFLLYKTSSYIKLVPDTRRAGTAPFRR